MLSSVLNADEDINVLTERLIKKVNGCIAMNFKKVRITRNKKNKLEILHERMRKMKRENKQEELDKVIEEVAIHEEERYSKVIEELAKIKDQTKLDSQKFWKVKKKLCPKTIDPPSVMLDSHKNLLTTDKAIEDRAL